MSIDILERPVDGEVVLPRVDTQPSIEADVPPIDFETAGADIRAEFERLWDIYAGRRAGLSFDFRTERVEFDVIATRYFHGQAIEEVYSRTTEYNLMAEGHHRESQTVTVLVTTDDGEHEIAVDRNSDVTVRERTPESDTWQDVSNTDRGKCHVDEFFHRTLDAAAIHGERGPEDKQRADASALGLLYARYPELAQNRSAIHD